jgi:hypothetical protein
MTLATVIGYRFAGFVVRATGPRPVYIVEGVVDMLSAIALGIALRQNLTRVPDGHSAAHGVRTT